MRQDGRASAPDAAPVWTAMAYLLAHRQRLLSQFRSLFLDVEYTYYATHDFFSFFLFFEISKYRNIEISTLPF